eukprot:TRINITY_DN8397_c0_g1_i11.p1 TRINITY_DN8397_c0_g1~~TRINITY_DN8397_c0_g1_i11.p1  ORF type:complete len:198 (+),score=60.46 TRINITY_DN8397_c0_g1_i11:91-684(+)
MKRVHERKINIIMLGESRVGKTALVKRYHDDTFTSHHLTTLGIDFIRKEIKRSATESVVVKIWDTAGQEKFRTITKSFYQQADGILLVFDLTDSKSFMKLNSWVATINETAGEGVIKFIVGNKLDLAELRVVDREEAMRTAGEYESKYYETSAKQNVGVEEVFSDLIEEVYNHLKDKNRNSKMLEPQSVGSWACCKG